MGGTVGEQNPALHPKKFGRYLRKIREDRRLSLDTVEEMSFGFPGRVTKSHLSRIENGLAEPSFPRMFALSQIYGVPIASLADRFESDLRREMHPSDLSDKSDGIALTEARELTVAGRYSEALMLYEVLLERTSPEHRDQLVSLRLLVVNCLIHLGRYGLAKEESEALLGMPALTGHQRLSTLRSFAISCCRLQKYSLAMMVLDQVDRDPATAEAAPGLRAELLTVRGNTLYALARFDEATEAYHTARKLYVDLSLTFEACRVTINLASALIEKVQPGQARQRLRQALEEAEQHGYDRLIALALSNLGLIAYREDDLAAAESYCLRSNALARPREYLTVVFRNCYYLWKIADRSGDEAGAVTHERALRRYAGRIEESIPELECYRAHLAGGAR